MNKYSLNTLKLKPTQILVFGFLSLILIGTLLLNQSFATVSGVRPGILTALFTSTSAVCVTGLVTVDTGTYWSIYGQTIIMMLIQMGGLGFMTMATLVFLLLGKKITLKERLVIQQSLNEFKISGVVRLVKYIIIATVLIEFVGAFFLSFRFINIYGFYQGIYYSIFHSISAFNNAGFDLIGGFESFTIFAEDTYVNFVIISLIITGGLGFTVIFDIIKKRKLKKLSLHTKLVLLITFFLIFVGFIIVITLEHTNPNTLNSFSTGNKILASTFQSVTTRTAGFNTLDISELNQSTQFFILILMFIGGSPSSTAGGIKTVTFGVLLISVWSVVKGSNHTTIFNRRIPTHTIFKALSIIIISLTIIVLNTLILSTIENADFLVVLFEVFSAFGTVGLSMGLTQDLSELGQILIIITMFIGRVGPLTLALALGFKNKSDKVKYPEENVLIG